MRKLLLLCAAAIGWMSADDIFPEQMFIQKRTNNIYHRYYLTKRLKSSILLLRSKRVQQLIAFEQLDPALFRQPKMQKTVVAIMTDKSLDALFSVWDDFCMYQHLYSSLFENELIELIYYICDLIQPYRTVRSQLSLEQKLYVIDQAVDEAYFNKRSSGRMPERDIDEVTTDLVAKRFFIIKRLQKSMNFLEYLQQKSQDIFMQKEPYQRIPLEDNTGLLAELEHFSHDRVRECIEQMCERKNLDPLLRMCKEFKQYRFAQDDTFLQEMLMNIFLVYKSLLFKDLSAQTEQVVMTEMNQVLEIYENLESLPLDETLEAIDIVTDKLIAIQALESKQSVNLAWIVPGIACMGALGAFAYFYMN